MAIVNTGYKQYNNLEQYNIGTGVATGTTKVNAPTDVDYVPPVYDSTTCPPPTDPVITLNKVQLRFINQGAQFISFGNALVTPWNAESPAQYYYNTALSMYPGETKNFIIPAIQQIGDWINLNLANNTNSKILKLLASVYFTNSTGRTLKDQVTINVGGAGVLTYISVPRTNVGGTNLIEIIFTDIAGVDPDPNTPPTAHAGPDQSIALEDTNSVQLAGSGTDVDGTIVGYQWSRLSGPIGYTIDNPLIANPILSDLLEGVYVFELTVTDNLGAIGRDQITITVTAVNNPNGLVIALVDSTLTSSTISAIKLIQGSTVINVLSSAVTSSSGAVVNSALKGVYDLEVITTGTAGSVRINQAGTSNCQTYSGAGSYVFFGVTVDSGSAGLAVSLTAGDCSSTPTVYAKKVLGATSHVEQALAPWGKEITDSQIISALFYTDSGATTPATVSLVLNYRIVAINSLTSTVTTTNTYTVLTSQTSVVIGGITHHQEWDYTLNDPLLIETADKIDDTTFVYSLLPGAGYTIIP